MEKSTGFLRRKKKIINTWDKRKLSTPWSRPLATLFELRTLHKQSNIGVYFAIYINLWIKGLWRVYLHCCYVKKAWLNKECLSLWQKVAIRIETFLLHYHSKHKEQSYFFPWNIFTFHLKALILKIFQFIPLIIPAYEFREFPLNVFTAAWELLHKTAVLWKAKIIITTQDFKMSYCKQKKVIHVQTCLFLL